MRQPPSEQLHVGRPNIGDRQAFLERVNGILDRRWLTNNGPLVQEFESKIADLVGVRHAVAMCNATAALEIASRAMKLTGEVILPSYTFIATAHSLQWQGVKPVFVDMNPQTHNIDVNKIEQAISPNTTGIVGVHVWGRACNVEEIDRIARRHNLRVMYDASHAFGCSHRGRMIGSFGSCEIFSFHATKFINCFEGGAVVTNDDDLAKQMRLMRNFGFAGFDNVTYIGINGKLSEVHAAMGLTSLEAMTEIVERNRSNFHAYKSALSKANGISIVDFDSAELNNYQYVVIEVDPEKCKVDRDAIVDVLHANGIIARKYFWPGCHRMEPYRTLQPDAGQKLPVTEKIAARIIVLPTGQSVDADTVSRVCQIILECIQSKTTTGMNTGIDQVTR